MDFPPNVWTDYLPPPPLLSPLQDYQPVFLFPMVAAKHAMVVASSLIRHRQLFGPPPLPPSRFSLWSILAGELAALHPAAAVCEQWTGHFFVHISKRDRPRVQASEPGNGKRIFRCVLVGKGYGRGMKCTPVEICRYKRATSLIPGFCLSRVSRKLQLIDHIFAKLRENELIHRRMKRDV